MVIFAVGEMDKIGLDKGVRSTVPLMMTGIEPENVSPEK